MKCCKKTLLVAAVLGVGVFLAARTGWGEFGYSKLKSAMKKNISPEVRLEKARMEIAKLDRDIESNWTPIAEKEQEVKLLKRNIDGLRASVERSEADLQAAVADLKAGVKRVKYKGETSEAAARHALLTDASNLASHKRELTLREQQLVNEQKALKAAMETQEAMFAQRSELDAEVSALAAELKVLKLKETESKLVLNNGSRLDDIKASLAEIRRDIDVRTRVMELRESHRTKTDTVTTEKAKELTNEEVISKVNSVLNQGKEVGNGE